MRSFYCHECRGGCLSVPGLKLPCELPYGGAPEGVGRPS